MDIIKITRENYGGSAGSKRHAKRAENQQMLPFKSSSDTMATLARRMAPKKIETMSVNRATDFQGDYNFTLDKL
ncbi:hypothetical protein RGU70_17365 [Herbaspirillum sp. RTI4]|uniref:hypothetical protein n=1 Tax=Herbaspirillum sp. RTI4 TaxID=3048640 RepID=UPI002AB562C9|nr:hypothetical protein [Herbaspirillum sp. RTI4]MDY7580081.1 hypothetical protein [Herbaspirillum sp. RTI4]MEA9983138.1 hypothetical protein [Herbaspirillum sp. RTI4]